VAETLLGGLMELLNNDSELRTLVPSGVWLGSIPPELPSLPYLVLLHGGEDTEETTEYDLDTGHFTLIAFDKSPLPASKVETIQVRIKQIFRSRPSVQLNITGVSTVGFRRGKYLVMPAAAKGPRGEMVFQASREFQVQLQE
jgi:hypothetical protein